MQNLYSISICVVCYALNATESWSILCVEDLWNALNGIHCRYPKIENWELTEYQNGIAEFHGLIFPILYLLSRLIVLLDYNGK